MSIEDFRLARLAELLSDSSSEQKNPNHCSDNNCFYEILEVFQTEEGGEIITSVLKDIVEDIEKSNGKKLNFAGIGHGGGVIASVLGYVMHRPACTIFRNMKTNRNFIRGAFKPESEYLAIDECWTSGFNSLNSTNHLKEGGSYASHAVAILEKSEYASDLFKQAGIVPHYLLREEDILESTH